MSDAEEAIEAIQVTAAVIRRDGKILLAQRKRGHLAGKWEFPGGKIEQGEKPEECLARELREEFEIDARVGHYITTSRYRNKDIDIDLHGYEVEHIKGVFALKDHDAIEWVDPKSLLKWDLAEADIPIARVVSGVY